MHRKTQAIALALISLISLSLLQGCGRQQPGFALKIYVDGSDVVKLSENKLWLEHETFNLPGNSIYIDGRVWVPQWNDKTTVPYEGVTPAFAPTDAKKIKLTKLAGRGTVTIIDLPTADNKQTLSFRIDDDQFGGADWYEVLVSW